jgi:hypothetical protein
MVTYRPAPAFLIRYWLPLYGTSVQTRVAALVGLLHEAGASGLLYRTSVLECLGVDFLGFLG